MIDTDRPAARSPARERILCAARRLFYEKGIRATGTNRLIQEARVTKVTFYRYFPSKADLVVAFLDDRHERWMAWFQAALARHGGGPEALVPALAEWFGHDRFRGCAFVNTLGEQGPVLPQTTAITRRHKQAMVAVIAGLLTAAQRRRDVAQSLAIAVDGAIVWAGFAEADSVLAALERMVGALTAAEPGAVGSAHMPEPGPRS